MPTYAVTARRAEGNRVLILGAGLAGMVAAYELTKRGYSCLILEARSRPGGRCWTVRRGTVETKVGLQFARRCWEEDEAIYGGISWTNLPIRQIWYPSTG